MQSVLKTIFFLRAQTNSTKKIISKITAKSKHITLFCSITLKTIISNGDMPNTTERIIIPMIRIGEHGYTFLIISSSLFAINLD